MSLGQTLRFFGLEWIAAVANGCAKLQIHHVLQRSLNDLWKGHGSEIDNPLKEIYSPERSAKKPRCIRIIKTLGAFCAQEIHLMAFKLAFPNILLKCIKILQS